MPQIGSQLGYDLKSYAGLYSNIIQTVVPLNWIVNTTVTQINGDTIEWDYFVVSNINFEDDDDFPDGSGNCDGADVDCPGTNKITHTLKKRRDKVYPLSKCRIDNISTSADLRGMTAQGLLDAMVAEIEAKYASNLSKMLVNKLVSDFSSITDFVPSVAAINVIDRIEESVVDIENLHEMSRSAQTLIVSNTISSEMRKLNYLCCELTTGFVPESQNKVMVERQIAVPDAWLYDTANTTQYDFVNYVRALYAYYENCSIARTIEMTNEYDGYYGYHKKAVYGWFMDETVSQIPETQDVGGHKVATVVAP